MIFLYRFFCLIDTGYLTIAVGRGPLSGGGEGFCQKPPGHDTH
jgi:hypothetical protein